MTSTGSPGPAEIISQLPVLLAVEGHHELVPFYLTAEMFGGMPVEIAGADLSTLVNRPVAAPHTHDVDEIYFLICPVPAQARIEVHLQGKLYELTAPSVMRIPAGSEHFFVVKEATVGSYCFGILLGAQP